MTKAKQFFKWITDPNTFITILFIFLIIGIVIILAGTLYNRLFTNYPPKIDDDLYEEDFGDDGF